MAPRHSASLGLSVLALGALVLASGGLQGLLMLAPAILLLAVLATGRYPGERVVLRLRRAPRAKLRRAMRAARRRPRPAGRRSRPLLSESRGLRAPPLTTTA